MLMASQKTRAVFERYYIVSEGDLFDTSPSAASRDTGGHSCTRKSAIGEGFK
jgi:hypothetical protein